MIIRDEMVVILESLRKLVHSLVCRFAPVMFKKEKGERGEEERRGSLEDERGEGNLGKRRRSQQEAREGG